MYLGRNVQKGIYKSAKNVRQNVTLISFCATLHFCQT